MTLDFYFCADIKHTNSFNVQSKQWYVHFVQTVEGNTTVLIFFFLLMINLSYKELKPEHIKPKIDSFLISE